MRKGLLLGIFTVFAFTGVAHRAEASCSSGLVSCYQRAATIDSFWYRWAAGLECELDFLECARGLLLAG